MVAERFNTLILNAVQLNLLLALVLFSLARLNELAHNYINLLTHEDRESIMRIICAQQVNFVDVMSSNKNNLQSALCIRATAMRMLPSAY